MPIQTVRFKGLLSKSQRERLTRAGITVESSQPSMQVGLMATGRPIYTVVLEATSPGEALEKVRQVMEPDTATFANWEAVHP
ncbi:MAG TPA: hypothetical protein VFM51_02975 [Solirubrobacterales bacterium]|nr:hypothetical protein [Solirubrobacterales bacterium]